MEFRASSTAFKEGDILVVGEAVEVVVVTTVVVGVVVVSKPPLCLIPSASSSSSRSLTSTVLEMVRSLSSLVEVGSSFVF